MQFGIYQDTDSAAKALATSFKCVRSKKTLALDESALQRLTSGWAAGEIWKEIQWKRGNE